MVGFFFSWGDLKYDKPSLTVEQQVELLKKRGMQFSDPQQAADFLFHHNYYRLRGFWIPLEDETAPGHTFKKGTTFDHVVHLSEFDRKLRLLVFDAVERLEISFRTAWAYHFSLKHGPHAYLDKGFFKDIDKHKEHLKRLSKDVEKSTEIHIVHYKEKYRTPSKPPIWSVSELMSLGTLSKWFENLQPKIIKKEIAARYNLPEPVFESFLQHLTTIRNICAHHSKLWNRHIVVTMKLPRDVPELTSSLNPDNQTRLYNTLVMLAYLIEVVDPGNHWKQRLVDLIEEYQPSLKSIGFPEDYKKRKIWRNS